MFDNLPATLLSLFLALCCLWLIVRVIRRLFTSRRTRQEPSLEPVPEVRPSHSGLGEPQLARSVSTIPDAADVLALKAAIDNLARQVAALEKRLAVDQQYLPSQPSPGDKDVGQSPIIPPVSPDHRI